MMTRGIVLAWMRESLGEVEWMVIQCDTVVRSLSILPLASLSLSVCSAVRLSHTGFSRWAKCVKGELLNRGRRGSRRLLACREPKVPVRSSEGGL